METFASLAEKTVARLEELGQISDDPTGLCRTFLSPASTQANQLVSKWMEKLGLYTRVDSWGNLIGRWEAEQPDAPVLILGSHLDTVRNAGKFDGPLGILVSLACIEALQKKQTNFPFHVDIIGFSDEEGTRFHSAYLGSKAILGKITEADLCLRDAAGITLAQAVASFQQRTTPELPHARYPSTKVLAYVEVHLEQGPMLEEQNLALGVVEAIAAQSRLSCEVVGKAGHAGTTPMGLRRDALAGAATLISWIETHAQKIPGLVGTVGHLELTPNVSNVIPARVLFSVDVRHPELSLVRDFCQHLADAGTAMARARALSFNLTVVQSNVGVACTQHLIQQLSHAIGKTQTLIPRLVSGAGHDGVQMAELAPIGMLFVRCRAGLSHHPDEYVQTADVQAAIEALTFFLENFA